jgi:hypothetical protein
MFLVIILCWFCDILMNYEVFIWHAWVLFERIQVEVISIWSVPCVLSYALLSKCCWFCSLHCSPFASVHIYYSWSWSAVVLVTTDTILSLLLIVWFGQVPRYYTWFSTYFWFVTFYYVLGLCLVTLLVLVVVCHLV